MISIFTPKLPRLKPESLKGGQYVTCLIGEYNQIFCRKHFGHIQYEQDRKYSSLIYICLITDSGKRIELFEKWKGDATFRPSEYGRRIFLFKSNKLQRSQTMANKLLSALRLNAEQRKLSKVGVYDENGNLTQDGQELLLNFLAKKHEADLVDLTKDMLKKCEKGEKKGE